MNAMEWLQVGSSYVVQASMVLATAWVLDRWSTSPISKTRIWTCGFFGVLILFAAAVLLPRLQWMHPWSGMEPALRLGVTQAQTIIGRCMLAIWLFGATTVVLRWAFQAVRIQYFVRGCVQLSERDVAKFRDMFPSEKWTVHGQDIVHRVSPEAVGPFCFQLHQPTIFLPRSLLDGDPVVLKHVLAHELSHLHTQHPKQLFLQKLVQAILWFNPLVWTYGRRAGLVREFVCDENASAGGPEVTASYLAALLQVVRCQSREHPSGFSIARSHGELRIRARRLVQALDHTTPRYGWISILALFLMIALASQFWLPTNPVSSSRESWSRWPTWTASALHAFNISARDFEPFQNDIQLYELIEKSAAPQSLSAEFAR